MTLMEMRRTFRKYGVVIGGLLAFVMIVGVVFTGFGANIGSGPGPMASTDAPGMAEIATVGEAKVTRAAIDQQLEAAVRQQQSFGQPPPPPDQMDRLRLMLIEQMKNEQAMVAAAKKAGITVSDDDVEKARDEMWAQARKNYAQMLGLKENATDSQINAALSQQQPGLSVSVLKEQIPDDQLRTQLYAQKLQDKFKQGLRLTASEDKVRQSYSDVKVRHILIKSGEGGLPDEQAKAKAEKLLAEVKANPDKLAALATQHTDDPGSKKNGGLYDWAPAAQYVPAFTQAALDAGVGKVYPELVKTPYGYHIVKSEGVRPGKTMPKDFDKNKQKYIDEYVERLAMQEAQEAVQEAAPGIKVTVSDPLLRSAQIQDEARGLPDKKAREAKLNEALTLLSQVKKADDPSGVVPLRRASIYEALGKQQEAVAAYKEALEYRNTVETRLALANLYISQKNKAEAAKQLEEALNLPVPDVQTQFQLGFLLKQAGRDDLAKKAQEKAQQMLQRQMAAQQQQMKDMALPEKDGKGGGAAAADPHAGHDHPPIPPGPPQTGAPTGP